MTPSATAIVVACLLLGAGTYLTRLLGVLSAHRLTLSARHKALLAEASVVMLVALAITGAVLDGRELAPSSRWIGVAVGAVLAALKVPFVVVVIVAAAVSALLRLAGMP